MDAGTHSFEIKAILALFHFLPNVGEEYLLTSKEYELACRLKSIVLQPCHSSPSDSGDPGYWTPPSTLALVGIEFPSIAFGEMLEAARAHPLILLHAVTREPVGAGLMIPRGPSNGSELEGLPPFARGLTVWMTGLSGAGKTTIANELQSRIQAHSRVEMLDADIVRTHICKGLGFTEEDRRENVWRLALTASMLSETGAVVLVSAISPYRTAREQARDRIGSFIEVYVNAPLSVCEGRDVKGLYKKARSGEIHHFTGIDDPYEPPLDPEVECRTDMEPVSESVAKIMAEIEREWKRRLEPNPTPIKGPTSHGH